MKILLVNLPWKENGLSGVRAGSRWPHIKHKTEKDYLPFPFYLAYSTAILEKHGFDARITDAIAEEMTTEEFIKKVEHYKPDVLVAEISAPSRKNDFSILEKLSNNIKIIVCGPDTEITNNPKALKTYPFISATLSGEYEQSLLALLNFWDKQIPFDEIGGITLRNNFKLSDADIKNDNVNDVGLHYRGISAPRVLSNVDTLPLPHRKTLPMKKYIDAPGGLPLPSVQMWASRGCPFNCSFCAWTQIMCKPGVYRPRNIENVLDEMEFLAHKMKFKSIYFDDDTFNVGHKRMMDFLDKLIVRRKNNKILVPWAIMARADLMTEELLDKFKEAGLYSIKYGVESAEQDILNNSSKKMSLDKTIKMIKYSQKIGIKTHLTFIIGLIGETKTSLMKTIDLAISLNPDSLQFSLATPFPGTKLYDDLKNINALIQFDSSDLDGNYNFVIKSPYFTPSELIKAKNDAYTRWETHCHLRRNPKKIKLSKWHMEKAKMYFNHYGLKSLIYKTFDYFKFFILHNINIMSHKHYFISHSHTHLALHNNNLKIYFKDREITRGSGLQSSFRLNGKRYDTSLCLTNANKIQPNEFFVQFDFKTQDLEIKQIWLLYIIDNKIVIKVDWFSEKPFTITELKFSVVVSNEYSAWETILEKNDFPTIEDWYNIPHKITDDSMIKVHSTDGLPSLMFDFFSITPFFKEQIQNTGRDIYGRMLNAFHKEEFQINPGRNQAFS
ncbi:MAG: magnesium-protoporphyrin IX monomethyl ester anaerobic oxidative cyclase BchE, partial [uncultured bacterium]